jgi:PAS domain-containing protein
MPVEATLEERIERLAQLAEVMDAPREALRVALRREFSEALAIERKRTRLASVVAMSEEDAVRYRVISELASDWVYAVRIDEFGALKLEWVSGSFAEVTGYTVDEINALGGLSAVIHPEDMGRLKDDDSPLKRGAPATVHYRFLTRSGQELWLRDHACRPITTTSSPGATSSPVTSIVIMSMQTDPTIGTRWPRTSTDPSPARRVSSPSA